MASVKLRLMVAMSVFLLACHPSPPSPQPLDWNAADAKHIAWLDAHGRRLAGRQVVVVAPPEEISAEWQAALLDSLDRGMAAMRRLIGAPVWQRIGGRPVQFYLVPERVISHASGRDIVFISVSRVQAGDAPYLHEAAHELLAPPPPFLYDEYPDTLQAEAQWVTQPYWLMEGLPDVLALRAAAASGMKEGDVFRIGGLEKADSTCAARLISTEYRDEILQAIGGTGAPDALFTIERGNVAPAFYACAQSMSRFLVEVIGVAGAVELFPAIKRRDWAAIIARRSGVPPDTLRARWQRRLGVN